MVKKYARGGETGKGITFKSGESIPKKHRTKKKIPAHRGTGSTREIKVGDGSIGDLFKFILGDNDISATQGKNKIKNENEKGEIRIQAADALRRLSNKVSLSADAHAKNIQSKLQPTRFDAIGAQLVGAREEAYKYMTPPTESIAPENIVEDTAEPELGTSPTDMIGGSPFEGRPEDMANAERAPIVESPELGTPPPDMRGRSPFEGRPVADVARPVDRAAPPQMGGTTPMSNQQIIGLGETAAARSPEEYTRENMEKRRREAEAAQNIINQRTQPAVTDETPAGQAVTDTDDYPAVMYRYGGAVTPKRKKRKKRLYKGGKVNSYKY